jgi:hypothetical protein
MQNESRAIMITTQPPDAAPTIIPIFDVLELLEEDALAVAEAETVVVPPVVPPAENDAGAAKLETDASDWPLEATGAVEDMPDLRDVVEAVPAEDEAVNVVIGLDVLVRPGNGVEVSMDPAAWEVMDTLSGVDVPDADFIAEVGEGTDDKPEALGGGAVVSSESTWLQRWLSNNSHRSPEATDSYVA